MKSIHQVNIYEGENICLYHVKLEKLIILYII